MNRVTRFEGTNFFYREISNCVVDTDRPIERLTQPPASRGWVALAFAAYLCGLLSGLVAALFRLALGRADTLRGALATWAQPLGLPGCLLMMALVAVMAAMAAWLVQRFAPSASGSGIPHVETAQAEVLRRRLRRFDSCP